MSWNKKGTQLASCLSSGTVYLWDIEVINAAFDDKENSTISKRSVKVVNSAELSGGHTLGRTIFGAKYVCNSLKEFDGHIITWGADGKVCAWDSQSTGHVTSPLETLVNRSDYPVYALDVSSTSMMAVGGGVGESFIGVPMYLYKVKTDK